MTLKSHIQGAFEAGSGEELSLFNPATEEVVASLKLGGLDALSAVTYAREVGGAALRELTFAQRGALVAAVAKVIHAHRDELLDLARINGGNTRGDAKFDVDGAIGTLSAYAEIGQGLGERRQLIEDAGVQLGRSPRLWGQHVRVPRTGVAVHINAFNFPAWGLGEKLAPALIAGMPVIVKPAPQTAAVAARLVERVVEAKILPAGVLSLWLGSPEPLCAVLGAQDVIAFTGSSRTAALIRRLDCVVDRSVHLNVEADSINAATIGPDVEVGSDTYQLALTEIAREITQKAGQKCTAIRRILVPEALAPQWKEDLAERLSAVKLGDPSDESVRLGPLTSAKQRDAVRAGLAVLAGEADFVLGDVTAQRGLPERGYFVPATLLSARGEGKLVHSEELFGPVATVIAYNGTAAAAGRIVTRSDGALVSAVYTDDRSFLLALGRALGPHQGRLYVGSAKIAGQSIGSGAVLPQLNHGGPGRAGGGEELGGVHGLDHYLQRVALQGDRALIEALAQA